MGVATSTADEDFALPPQHIVSAVAASAPSSGDASSSRPTALLRCYDGGLGLCTEWGSEETLALRRRGIWAIWWDRRFNHADDAESLFGQLEEVRGECVGRLGMADPPNPGKRSAYNVYIHHKEDAFPNGWACGQGTDRFGLPYLTLPGDGMHREAKTIYHEGFHIFQYRATSKGFVYSGNSQWYIEASAQWYMARKKPEERDMYVEATCISMNPHLALWHTLENGARGDARDWLYMCRLYALNTWLVYLTDVSKVDPSIITDGFYAGTSMSPQEYHCKRVPTLRTHFADWAACNAAGLDYGGFEYLTSAQRERARQELENLTQHGHSSAEHRHEYTTTLTAPSEGAPVCFRPSARLPRGWSYNVVRVELTGAGVYTVRLRGDAQGSERHASHFLGRVAVGAKRYMMEMLDTLTSLPTVVQTNDVDRWMFVVIIAVPEHFDGNQTYGYEVDVESGAWSTPGQQTGGVNVASAAEMRQKRLEALQKSS